MTTKTNQNMRIKYNRVSTMQQSGARFSIDKEEYDLVLMDKVSGSVAFKERPKAKELVLLVESGQVSEIIVEEFSRLGRNMADVINVLQWLEQYEVNDYMEKEDDDFELVEMGLIVLTQWFGKTNGLNT